MNAAEADAAKAVDIKSLLVEVEKVRKQGHALSLSLVTPGAGVVAMPLPKLTVSSAPLAICVAGLTDALVSQQKEFAGLMRTAIRVHLSD